MSGVRFGPRLVAMPNTARCCRRSISGSSPRPIAGLLRSGGPIAGITLIEALVVVAIIAALTATLLPLVAMLREHARIQEATAVVRTLSIAVSNYAGEDPQRRSPPAEADGLIREDPTGQSVHLMDLLEAAHSDGGIHTLAGDGAHAPLRVLLDPWLRPYRYALDDAGSLDPSVSVPATRPDPARLDWNATGRVPFAYIWSLGPALGGHAGMMAGDPDAQPGSGARWIYIHTTPGQGQP